MRKSGRWPPETQFLINNAETLAKVRTQNGEWLGLYHWYGPTTPLICSGRSISALRRQWLKLGLGWPVLVRRSQNKRDLPVELGPAPVPRWEQRWRTLQRQAFEAIGLARNRMDPTFIWLPDDAEAKRKAMAEAKEFLSDLSKAARNSGEKRGRKNTQKANQRMIEALKKVPWIPEEGRLRIGNTKEALQRDVADPLKAAKVLRTQLRRFCLRVYDIYQTSPTGRELREECGFTSENWPLVKKAYIIGKSYADRERQRHPERRRVTSQFRQIAPFLK